MKREYSSQSAAEPVTAKNWFERGNELLRAGSLPAALEAFRHSIRLNPGIAAPWVGLAQVLLANGQGEDARECLKRAVSTDPRHLLSRIKLAHVHKDLGHIEDALKEMRVACELDPGSVAAQFGMGQLQEDIGEPGAAAVAYREALRLDSGCSEALANLLGLGRFVDISEEIEQAKKRLTESDDRNRALVAYGLGKALEQEKNYPAAFDAYRAANQARRNISGSFDRDAFDARIALMISVFSREYFQQRRGWGDTSTRPVFVVGLPRSGTTLTEQIIASHPDCYGAGELGVLTDLATGMPDRLGKAEPPWPACAPELDSRQAQELARDYLARSAERAPGSALRVVDKQPLNFWHLGLVATVLPHARIIHCTRDIRDCGLSIYTQNFNVELKWATDLGDIAHFWRGYHKLMQHWKAVTRLEILDCSYEDTVADLEKQARRLLQFVDLPWDERVLEFHLHDRAVQTPSRWQVRQPLYQSALARWRNYEAQLGPLLKAAAQPEA